ncbi:uncharacterized protein LOC131026050 [Salvia miltiorrhiza]|uniref:uncharacterized protein LOC131026050 n=1 Tax=Salvia miltiorrhiza TaxID=226208 RepID=UPI0025ABF6DF|nr:uncharacterized protein LOC131026050 [Salvia miltiorrhiza]
MDFILTIQAAYAGMNHAIKLIYGDLDKSFQLIRSYLHMVQHCNPDSIIDLETDGDDVFNYCFMALGGCIRGLLLSGRHVVVVDATHLKGKYKGVMFVAVTKDGNEHIFLSYQHISLKNVVEAVFPGVPHGLCTYHLQKNLVRYGANAVAMFQRAANSYKREQYDLHSGQLTLLRDKGAYRKLMDLQPSRWARSHCGVHRYKFMMSNCTEVFNGRLRWGRRLPVCTLLEFVRTLISHWFAEMRSKALARTYPLTEYAALKLDISIEESRIMEVNAINAFKSQLLLVIETMLLIFVLEVVLIMSLILT